MKNNLQAIEKEIARLKAEAEKLRTEEVSGVIERIRLAIEHYGLTPDQLFGGRGGKRKEASATGLGVATGALVAGVPKYLDPASGKTWTGRGKPPAWIAGVADRTQFEIKGSAAAGVAKKSSAPVKGGIPKYKDPTSGKTWTGNGKPPAWIAGAADRSAFEIDSATAKGSAKKKPGPKNVGVPKYRDPASGKTWTGNGMPPAWIAGAADRSVFLIPGAGAGGA